MRMKWLWSGGICLVAGMAGFLVVHLISVRPVTSQGEAKSFHVSAQGQMLASYVHAGDQASVSAEHASSSAVHGSDSAATRNSGQGSFVSTGPSEARDGVWMSVGRDGRTYDADHLGNFPKMMIDGHSPVPVTLRYRDGAPGDPVMVELEDGGSLDGKGIVRKLALDGQREIHFTFEAGDDEGTWRISVVKLNDFKTLHFQVGSQEQ